MLSKFLTRFKDIPLEARVSMAYAVCSILQNCLGFITLPIFTRIMTTEQFGQFTIYSSWSAILVIFITLNLPYGSFSTAMVKFEDKRDEYIASVEAICLTLAALFFVIYLPFSKYWNDLFELPTIFIVIMVFELLANAGIMFWNGKQRFEYKYKAFIAVTLFNSLLAPILAYVLVMSTEDKGYARIIGYSSVTIVVGGIIFIMNLVKGKRIFNKELWKYALGFNLPLVCYYLSQVVFNQSDRIMIDHYYGKSEAAIYGVAYTLAMILTFVLNAINNSYVPWFYNKIKERKKEDNKSISCMISILMAFLLSGVIWLAPEIVLLMGGKQYADAIWIVPPVAVSVLLLFYSQLFINVEFYYEKKGHLVVASIFSALLNIVLNAIFIPTVGYIAAGYTTLVSYIVFVIANYVAMKKVLRDEDEENDAYDIRFLIIIFVVFLALSGLALVLYNHIIIRYIVIAVVLLGVAIKHKALLRYINMLREK